VIKYNQLFKNRNFFSFLIAQVISLFGDRLNQLLLIAIIYERSPNSSFALAKLFAFTIFPVFFVGPIAGTYTDIFEKKNLLLFANLSRGLILLVCPFIIFSSNIAFLYLIVLLLFSSGRFFLTAKLSFLPDIISEKELLPANTIISTFSVVVTSLSIGISGYLIHLIGTKISLYFNAIIYFIASIFISFISVNSVNIVNKSNFRRNGFDIKKFGRDLKEGLKFISKNKDIGFIMRIFSLLMAIGGGAYVTVIVFIQQSFGSVTKDLGALGMVLGMGFLLGAFLYGKYCQNLNKNSSLLISIAFGGLMIIIFSFCLKFSPKFFIAGMISFLFGMIIAPVGILATTILQEKLPIQFRGETSNSI
jgi:MFS family permease